MDVRIGMMLPMSVSDGSGRVPTWSEVRAVAYHAETVGLDSVWVCDHLLSEPPGQPVEGYRRLGIDDLIIGLRPVTVRSIDRLAEALAVRGE